MLVTQGFLGPLVAAAVLTTGGMALIPGCSTEAASARAAISISLSNPQDSSKGVCPAQSAVTLIGTGGVDSEIKNGTATTQADGSQQNGAAISVQCSVAGNDSAGYNVQATTSLAASWTTTIFGTFKPSATVQTGIKVQYSDASGFGNFSEEDCTATFTAGKESVAAGRARAEVVCPAAADPNKPGKACNIDVVFEFENCGQ